MDHQLGARTQSVENASVLMQDNTCWADVGAAEKVPGAHTTN